MINKNNRKLKTVMFEKDITHREAAGMLGINARVFTNKINRRMVNGYEARFTEPEKRVLATEFQISVEDIE